MLPPRHARDAGQAGVGRLLMAGVTADTLYESSAGRRQRGASTLELKLSPARPRRYRGHEIFDFRHDCFIYKNARQFYLYFYLPSLHAYYYSKLEYSLSREKKGEKK